MTYKQQWRQVDLSGNDKIEFRREDGSKFWPGCYELVVGILSLASLLWVISHSWNTYLESLRLKDYSSLAQLYCLGIVSFSLAMGIFLLGIWTLFGSTDVVLDKEAMSITKKYRLRSYCLLSKNYLVGNSASFFLRLKSRSFAPLHFLCLDDKTNGRRRVLVLTRDFVKEGREMAEQMASFFLFRCSREHEFNLRYDS